MVFARLQGDDGNIRRRVGIVLNPLSVPEPVILLACISLLISGCAELPARGADTSVPLPIEMKGKRIAVVTSEDLTAFGRAESHLSRTGKGATAGAIGGIAVGALVGASACGPISHHQGNSAVVLSK